MMYGLGHGTVCITSDGKLCFAYYLQFHLTLSLPPPFFLTVFVLDPMGEEHYTRGASWIPAFMVVVGPMCFPSFAHRAYYKSCLSDCVCLFVCKLVQVGGNFSARCFFLFYYYAQTS